MSDITSIEKLKLEKLFDMSGGYVLDFSNRTFKEFIFDSIGIDIYNPKYDYESGSKANRLRAFWQIESNYLVRKLTDCLLDYWKAYKQLYDQEISQDEQGLFNDCQEIASRLRQNIPIENLGSSEAFSVDEEFSLLSNSIQESVANNKPEVVLDRLHTLMVKFIRGLCDKHAISYDKYSPLHNLFGSYVRFLQDREIIESEMTIRILKTSISIIDAFNKVRNDQSFAHDNPILNQNESFLIVGNIVNLKKFIDSIEENLAPHDVFPPD